MLTKDKIIEIFCIADDFCKEFNKEIKNHQIEPNDGKKHRNRSVTMSDSEMITILLCFHFGSFRNFKHYYLFYVKEHLKDEFPEQFSYSRFIQLEHKILIPLLLFLKLVCFGECTGITFVDSTMIAVCKNKRIKRNKVFKGLAEVGKSTVGWFFGFKLHLVCNDKGELLNFCLTKGNVDDRNQDVFNVLSKNLFGKLYADKGYISSSLFEVLFNDGIHLVTGIRSNMKNRLMSLRDRILLRKRSVIETINDELKNICQVEHSRHRGTANFLINLLAGLAAYSFFDKKPGIRFDRDETENRQSALFY
ncbi:IS982 family transposase [Bacteroidales bacterium OttesenSCG-928-I21]|nr:IS982 family transposase [Bacteroidales bacterium OttesenSCG-928-I21]